MLKKLGKLLWSPVGWSGCGTSFFNVTTTNWILASNVWNDTGVWDDSDTWND